MTMRFFLFLLVFSAGNAALPAQTFKNTLPPGTPVLDKELACEAIIGTSIEQQPEDVAAQKLTTKVQKATDKLAIKVKERTLTFITVASVQAGQAEGAEFIIVKDASDYLMAVHVAEGALVTSLNSFLLNRKNGLAVWTKSRPSFLTIKTPETHSFYLVCR